MAALQCDICGGKLMGRPGGIFECDSCGMQYDTAWAKEKIQEIKGTVKVEGTVQVAGTVKVDGPIKVEGAATLPNLIARGFMAIESGHFDDARQTFGKALEMDPECGDAHLGIAIAGKKFRDRQTFWESLMNYEINEPSSLTKARECNLTEPYRTEMAIYKNFLETTAAKIAADHLRGEKNRDHYAALRQKYAPARAMLGDGYYEATLAEGCIGHYGLFNETDPRWREIVAVSCYNDITAGILPDGSVIICLEESTSVVNTAPAPKAVKICIGEEVIILRQDGTVIAYDKFGRESWLTNKTLSTWTDIVDIAATIGNFVSVIGVKQDGTLVADNEYLLNEQKDLCDIAQVVCSSNVVRGIGSPIYKNNIAFLTHTGRVILHADCKKHTINSAVAHIEQWSDIIQVSFHRDNILGEGLVGLKDDGTVVAQGLDKYCCKDIAANQEKLQCVQDAVAIKGLSFLLKDGHIMMVTSRYEKSDTLIQKKLRTDVPIRLFEHIDTLEAERRAITEKREALIRHCKQLESEIASLKANRASLGIFASKQKKEIDEQIAELEAKLKELN